MFWEYFFAHWIAVFLRITQNCYYHFGQSQMYVVIVIPKDGLTSVLIKKKPALITNFIPSLSYLCKQILTAQISVILNV